MNILNNLAKSTALAAIIFWSIIIAVEDINLTAFPFIVISLIPICICCTVMILGTIYPVFWITSNKKITNQKVFKLYFPYYAILLFFICLYGIILSCYEVLVVSFFISTYITSCQSWIWFSKEKKA